MTTRVSGQGQAGVIAGTPPPLPGSPQICGFAR